LLQSITSSLQLTLQPLASNGDFKEEVTRAIDVTLSEILGERGLGVLYRYLKDRYDIRLEEMPYQLPIVIRALEEIFGVVGSTAIGSDIAKKLYSQLGLRFVECSNYTIEDYIEDALFLILKR
jgi:hypothetical protein